MPEDESKAPSRKKDERTATSSAGGPQSRLMDIVRGMNEACFALDKDWCFTFVNDRCETLFHHRREEMLGNPIWEVFSKLVGTPMEKNYRRAMAEHVSVAFEAYSPIAERWVDIRLFPSGDGLAAFVLDIHDRKRAEQSQLHLAAIVNSSDDAIIGKTPEGIITSWNLGAEKIFGYSAAEAIGKSMLMLFPADRIDEERDILARITRNETVEHFETVRVRKDGKLIHISATISPIRDQNGNIVGASKIARDITEHKQIERILQQQASLVNQAHDAIFVWRWNGPITFWNRGAEQLYGFPSAKALGQTSHKLLQTQTSNGLGRMLAELQSEGQWEGELDHVTRDGRRINVESRMVLVREPDQIYVLETNRDITERKQAEHLLRHSQEQLQSLVEQAPVSIAMFDRAMRYIITSDRWLSDFGKGHDSLAGLHHYDLNPDIPERWKETHRRALAGESFKNDDDVWLHADGKKQWLRWAVQPWRNVVGEIGGIIILTEDTTRTKQLEAQFRQSQKMEAIGQLAGGVAHDFNNLLAVIQMNVDLIKDETSPLIQAEFIEEISTAAARGAALTRQLLLFSRKETMHLQDLDLNESINGMAKILRRTIGENIQTEFKFATCPLLLNADAGMIDQVLMNLAVNARDATPQGGRLVIETSAAEFDESATSHSAKIRPGSFVCLSVSDTGCGIPPENLTRIFEPFFTTKEVGKGTGLGLATVFGIVQQHQGWINVYSEVGQGTTFRIYLPRLATVSGQKIKPPSFATLPRGNETILLVEDDSFVRNSVHRTLSRLGYHVVEATNGTEALEVWKQYRDRIRLVITDMVMPGEMNGKELGERLLKENPDLKLIYASGYSAEVTEKGLAVEERIDFLTKPFPASKLAHTIRARLDNS